MVYSENRKLLETGGYGCIPSGMSGLVYNLLREAVEEYFKIIHGIL
jgi:hypothetical protein